MPIREKEVTLYGTHEVGSNAIFGLANFTLEAIAPQGKPVDATQQKGP
eukprot:CAMPEP_0181265044 /NCGR_PEP_ID=MMETSP1097-20121128/3494_1 /TAXON_ID=35684 /ORGANISM="Pseudopedinella elastica, Strain CCMP716" /LENGTH=47 /DNA_ID= /DNA_START= /DNA_END= /DNA_ORIENTATION=